VGCHPPTEPLDQPVSGAGQQALRLTAMVLAIAIGALGCLVIATQPPGQHGIYRWSGYAVGSTMLVGALLYAVGLGVWLDRTAFALRLSGWMLMASGAQMTHNPAAPRAMNQATST
jgi:hypothetical protein